MPGETRAQISTKWFFFCQETYLSRLDMFENSLLNIIHLKWKGSSSIRSHTDLTLNLYKRVLQRSFQPFHLILSFLHLIDGLSWFLMERVLMFDEGLVSSCWPIKQEGFECASNERQREKRKKIETEKARENERMRERESESVGVHMKGHFRCVYISCHQSWADVIWGN